MIEEKKPVANSMLVLREEFDDWAILFDPDTGDALGLNPVAVLIWKHMDGSRTQDDIVEVVRAKCEDVPDDAADHVAAFIDELIGRGYVGYEVERT